jgi:hypothetical protein
MAKGTSFKITKEAEKEIKELLEQPVVNDVVDDQESCNVIGEYSKVALDCLTSFMKRVSFLGSTIEYDEVKLVNYTNILCRLANEIKYIEECDEVDNEFCNVIYDTGEVSELRGYFD